MARAAIDEDADIVGVSFSSAAYVEYTRLLLAAMREQGARDIPLMLGGIIPPDDVAELQEMGVAGIFGAGSTMPAIIDFVRSAGRVAPLSRP